MLVIQLMSTPREYDKQKGGLRKRTQNGLKDFGV